MESHNQQTQTVSGSRFAVALASWSLSSIAVVGAFFIALVPFGIGSGTRSLPVGPSGFLSVVPLIAWICLAVMTVRWLQNLTCHWSWVFVGCISGGLSALFFIPAFFFYVPAFPLAFYLTYWHATHSETK